MRSQRRVAVSLTNWPDPQLPVLYCLGGAVLVFVFLGLAIGDPVAWGMGAVGALMLTWGAVTLVRREVCIRRRLRRWRASGDPRAAMRSDIEQVRRMRRERLGLPAKGSVS